MDAGKHRGTLLIVDDNEINREILENAFAHCYSSVTIPFFSILKEYNTICNFLIVSVCIIFAIIVFLFWHSKKENALVKRTNEVVRVLGNSYYALYRVNFENDTYEMVKGSDHVRERLPQLGKYSALMPVMLEVIESDAHEEFIHNFSCESIRTLVSRKVRDFGGEFRRLFGEEYRWVSVRIMFDESLAPEEVVLSFREIEQEKLWQLQERKLLEDTLETARRSEKARQAFFSNMSHDMRTPLNGIIGMSELAGQVLDDKEKLAGYLETIRRSGIHLKNLVDDILELSRMEEGRLDLNNQRMDLRQCVQDCLDAYRVQAEEEHKSLQATWIWKRHGSCRSCAHKSASEQSAFQRLQVHVRGRCRFRRRHPDTKYRQIQIRGFGYRGGDVLKVSPASVRPLHAGKSFRFKSRSRDGAGNVHHQKFGGSDER